MRLLRPSAAAPLANGADRGRRPQPDAPPDLDQLWRDFNQRLNRWLRLGRTPRPLRSPGQAPRRRPSTVWVVTALLLLAWLGSGLRTIAAGQQATLSLLGRRTAIVGPGDHWYWPAPLGNVRRYEVATPRQLEIGAGNEADGALLMSADHQLLDLRLQLSYRIVDLQAYLDHAVDPDQQLAAAAQALLRTDVAGQRGDDLLAAGHARIAAILQQQLQAQLASSALGLQLQAVSVVQALAPSTVLAAVDTTQQQLRQLKQQLQQTQAAMAAQQQADAAAQQRALQQAQQQQTAAVQQAHRDAERFAALLPSYASAPATTLLTLRRQTMVEVLGRADKVVVDASRVHPQIRIDVQGRQPATPSPASAALPASAPPADAAPEPRRELTRERSFR